MTYNPNFVTITLTSFIQNIVADSYYILSSY